MFSIRKAERRQAKLRLGISGPSGGGKTWSALEIAHGMGGKIGMIDTESGRGELYAKSQSAHEPQIKFDYDIIRLEAPYSPDRYIEAIKTFEREGHDILIIDSLSHAWSGEGGVLSIVEKAGGQYQNGWKMGTPKQNALIDTIINSKLHIICNMRAKTDTVMELNEKGKYAPRKLGLAPIQRDQLEYEFTTFMMMSPENIAHVTKDNSKLYNQEFIKPSPEMGRKLMEWLMTGKPQEEVEKEEIDSIKSSLSKAETVAVLRDLYKKARDKFPKMSQDFLEISTQRNKELTNAEVH